LEDTNNSKTNKDQDIEKQDLKTSNGCWKNTDCLPRIQLIVSGH